MEESRRNAVNLHMLTNLACYLFFNRRWSEESEHSIDVMTDFTGSVRGFCMVCFCCADLVSLGKYDTVTYHCEH